MGGQNGGRINITTSDWMRDMEKRTMHEERRPLVRTAADLMGPGLAPQAVLIQDWNDDVTAFNGIFYSEPNALNTPLGGIYSWIGFTEATVNGEGIQQVYQFSSPVGDTTVVLSYFRRFTTAVGQSRTYTPWVYNGTITPYVPPSELGTSVQFDGTNTVVSTVSTAFVGIAGGAQGDFIAPRGGKVMISISGYLKCSVAGQYAHLTWQWMTLPPGTITPPASGMTALDSFSTQDAGYTKASFSALQTGLLSQQTYNVRAAMASGSGTSTASVANTRIIVTPVI